MENLFERYEAMDWEVDKSEVEFGKVTMEKGRAYIIAEQQGTKVSVGVFVRDDIIDHMTVERMKQVHNFIKPYIF